MQADLRFRRTAHLTIAQFTDLHVQNRRTGRRADRRPDGGRPRCEQPDLAVLTGDVIDGKHSRTGCPPGAYAVAPLWNGHSVGLRFRQPRR